MTTEELLNMSNEEIVEKAKDLNSQLRQVLEEYKSRLVYDKSIGMIDNLLAQCNSFDYEVEWPLQWI